MATDGGYVSADGHVVEPADLWTRIDRELCARAPARRGTRERGLLHYRRFRSDAGGASKASRRRIRLASPDPAYVRACYRTYND
jgi:hypothetical protein